MRSSTYKAKVDWVAATPKVSNRGPEITSPLDQGIGGCVEDDVPVLLDRGGRQLRQRTQLYSLRHQVGLWHPFQ